MELLNYFRTGLSKERKAVIRGCMSEYNKRYTNTYLEPLRNKIAIPLHTGVVAYGFPNFVDALSTGDVGSAIYIAVFSKLNMDLAIWVNNINKIKASGFVRYMKNNEITDKKELLYGTKQYLMRAGSYHYPLLHPDKTKRLAETGEYTKTFETGILNARTDKKTLFRYLVNKMTSVLEKRSESTQKP